MKGLSMLPVGLLVGLSGSLLPGPMLAYTATKSLSDGAGVGTRVVSGHLLTEAFYLLLFLLGFRTVFQLPSVQTALELTGGFLLVLLAGLALRSALRRLETSPLVLGSNPLVGGVLLSSVLNPTVPLWWVGIGFPNLLAAYQLGSLLGLAFWLVGHALSDIVWFGGVSILCARGKKFIGTGFHRALLLGCSTFLLTWGAFLILHVAL